MNYSMGLATVVVVAGLVQAQPLSGPVVVEESRGTTLVQRGYEGLIKRLDIAPEEAALRLVDLDAATAAATQRVLVERTAMLDDLVLSNIDVLIELGGAASGGNKARAATLALELFYKSEPLRARGTLGDELASVMPRNTREEYNAIVDEYWNAVVHEGRARGVKKGRLGLVLEERGRLLGEEVQRAFARQVDKRGEQEFEALLARLELRPEQESRIRRMAEDFIIGAKFRPNPTQEAVFMVRIMSMLDEGQRQRLVGAIAEQAARDRGAAMQGSMEGDGAMGGPPPRSP